MGNLLNILESCDISGIDWIHQARAYGFKKNQTYKVKKETELVKVLNKTNKKRIPILIECII